MNDPLTDHLADPLTDPLTDPLREPLTDPLADPLTDPLTDPLDDLFAEPLDSPVDDPAHRGGDATRADHDAPTPTSPVDAYRALVAAPSGDDPEPAPASPAAADERLATVTCPRCKSTQRVAANRRLPTDFCTSCDYPLFWVAAAIELGSSSSSARAVGRLPGTGGVRTVASLICRHCAEPNEVDAVICRRCSLSLLEERRPAPAPPPPIVLPEVAPPPPKRTPLWVWIVLALITAVALGLIVWAAVAG